MPPKSNNNSKNLVKNKKKKKGNGTHVSKSFMIAYNKMLPSKERRRLMQIDMNTSPYLIPLANVVDNLTTCIQGTNIDQRLHNAIYISWIKLKGTISQKISIDKTRCFRIIIFKETNYNDFNSATMSDLFKSNTWTDQAPDGTANVGRYVVNRDRYQVLFDKRFQVRPKSDSGTTLISQNIRVGRRFFYPQKDPTFTDPIGGRLMAVCCMFEPDDQLSADPVHLELQWRVFFKDYKKIYGRTKKY